MWLHVNDVIHACTDVRIIHGSLYMQGSSAFVFGWILFGDRLSNGVAVKIIQQVSPNPHSPSLELVLQLHFVTYCMNQAYVVIYVCMYILRLAEFYRHVVVFTPLVASGIGLLTLVAMVTMDWWKQRRECANKVVDELCDMYD